MLNRHTILLSVLSLIGGLIIYGYLGMYPSYLRTHLGYSPQAAGNVMAFFGFGVLASIAGGAIGDRLPARVLLPAAFLGGGAIGFGLFHGPSNFAAQAGLSFLWGLIVSGTVYVNLAAYHVKAVVPRLAARSSGVFVTTLYASSSVAGYVFGAPGNLARMDARRRFADRMPVRCGRTPRRMPRKQSLGFEIIRRATTAMLAIARGDGRRVL